MERNISRVSAKRKLFSYYPDEGPNRRELYQKHLQFFAAAGIHQPLPLCPQDCDGSPHNYRLMLAANRVGKTEGIGGYECVLHLTGRYPDWWPGRRFSQPTDGWAAGKKNESTRDIVQKKLFGSVVWRGREKTVDGTGLIPAEDIGSITWKRGIADLIDTVKVRHRPSGGWSIIGLKSYEQGRGSFEGTEKDFVWLDEEPPLEVYTECAVRLMTRSGLMILTFTPMEGMSEVVLEFLPGGKVPKIRDATTEGYIHASLS